MYVFHSLRWIDAPFALKSSLPNLYVKKIYGGPYGNTERSVILKCVDLCTPITLAYFPMCSFLIQPTHRRHQTLSDNNDQIWNSFSVPTPRSDFQSVSLIYICHCCLLCVFLGIIREPVIQKTSLSLTTTTSFNSSLIPLWDELQG